MGKKKNETRIALEKLMRKVTAFTALQGISILRCQLPHCITTGSDRVLLHEASKSKEKMNTQFLQEHVNTVLSDGLASTVLQKPADPVAFLGKWLLSYVQSEVLKAKASCAPASIELSHCIGHERYP